MVIANRNKSTAILYSRESPVGNIVKVLLLSQFFSTTRGGGEHLFHVISEQLAKHDNQVWIITNRIKDEIYENVPNINIEFVPPELKYEGGLPPKFSDNFRFLTSSVNRGLKLIKRENIDLIHSNNFTPALAGGILSFLTSKPHITSVWDIFSLCGKNYWSEWTNQMNVSKINGLIGPIFEKLILRVPREYILLVIQQKMISKSLVQKSQFMLLNLH